MAGWPDTYEVVANVDLQLQAASSGPTDNFPQGSRELSTVLATHTLHDPVDRRKQRQSWRVMVALKRLLLWYSTGERRPLKPLGE